MNLRTCAVVAAAFLALPMAAQAGADNDVLRAMDRCAGVAEEHARLACYDQLAPQVKAALAEAPAAQASNPPTVEEQKSWFGFDLGNIFGSAPSQQKTPQQFGSENLPPPPPASGAPPPPEPIDSITAAVTDYAISPFGKFVVFLDNGQVWKEVEGDTEQASFKKSGGNTVVISRGFIGSYNLQVNDSKKLYKVKRVK